MQLDSALHGRRAVLLATILTLALLPAGCAGGGPTAPEVAEVPPGAPDLEEAIEAVLAAHQGLRRAFENSDAAAFLAYLDDSPEALIFHPLIENRFDGATKVKDGLAIMFRREGARSWSEFHPLVTVEGNVAWLTSHFLVETPVQRTAILGRGTEIWRRGPAGWKLVHAHWSQQPS
jgi:ketosteroid isomerase-like protein